MVHNFNSIKEFQMLFINVVMGLFYLCFIGGLVSCGLIELLDDWYRPILDFRFTSLEYSKAFNYNVK